MSCENWDSIVKEYEKDIDSLYEWQQGADGEEYRFVGLIHGSDDYYYGMLNVRTGKLSMCSCVGSLEGHGFRKICS